MLDINIIRENPKLIKENIKNRGLNIDLDHFLELDKKRSELIAKIDKIRSLKNKQKDKPTKEEIKALKVSKENEEKLRKELSEIEETYYQILYKIPNLAHKDVVISTSEDDNPVLEPGVPTKFHFEPRDHVKLAEDLDLIDFERAAKVSGAKFYYLKNELAILEFALIQYALDICQSHGYVPFSTPDLAKKEVLEGLGFQPRDEATQIYNIENTDLSLIGTAEITMGGYHMNEIIEESSLPLKYVAVSHCFRTEAGTYSKYSKGIFRIHQFTKVEMFQYVRPDDSETAHQEILDIEKEIYLGLKIPFRVIDHATCDLGSPAARTFDLEAWMPGKPNEDGTMGDWAEITSTSNCTDYQARGLNIKYRKPDGQKQYIHMLNGTAIATARTLISILENNQTKEGTILVPEVLQKWVGKKIISNDR